MSRIGLGLCLHLSGLCIAGLVATKAQPQWRFGISAVGLQMAIKVQVKNLWVKLLQAKNIENVCRR